MRSRLGVLLVGLSCCLAVAWAEVPVPPLKARVTDLTATFSAAERTALESDLQGVESRNNGSQVAVLLVDSTQPESIEQYAMRVVEAWKLGKKGVGNGLLLLVAKNDRKVRIEVGYGLEGVIPDAVAKRVIDETITPKFKQGDIAGGVNAGVQRLTGLIEGRALTTEKAAPTPSEIDTTPTEPTSVEQDFPERFADHVRETPIWLLIALVVTGTAFRWFLGPFFGGLLMGAAVGAGMWFLSGVLVDAIVVGVVAFIFVLVGLLNWLGLVLGGRSSSSGGGGGGFSGGGGDFGGGGASGSW